jgi:predicted enzyme related to lactoylglutathione lyase
MSLGWYVRFVPVGIMEIMDEFYGNVLGLSRLWHARLANDKPENKDLYWGGEAIVLNHNYGGRDATVGPREADPGSARQVQIFRVSELDAIVGRLRAQGVTVHGPVPCFHGREAFVLDPMGMLIGLRQRNADSPLPQDAEATRRRLRGEAFNPGCGPMPAGWQEIGWVRIRAANLEVMRAFYQNTLALPLIANADGYCLFDLGDNTTLELGTGGVSRPPPAMQMSSLAAMIFRVVDTNTTRMALKSSNVHFVLELAEQPRGALGYLSDPEGNVIGYAERRHPGVYVGALPTVLPPVSVEDAEAQRRWVEHKRVATGEYRAESRRGPPP